MKIFINTLIIFISLLSLSCDDSLNGSYQSDKDIQPFYLDDMSRSIVNNDSGYVYLPNPYSLDNMQEVYDLFCNDPIELEPTNLYVRFLPRDSVQLISLVDDYDIELFDYPLNIELDEDEEYVDYSIDEGEFSWLYSVVVPDFVFPSDIIYEILEECYIPEDNEVIEVVDSRVGSIINVEDMAYELLGYEDEEESMSAMLRGRVYPSGRIRVCDNSRDTLEYLPVKGVKVRCNRFVKFSTTYTDENGYYIMDSKFKGKPHFSLVFNNCKGFDVWGNRLVFARAKLNMGKHSANVEYSREIDATSKAWKWAAINNAGYDYYSMCEELDIALPPPNLKILVVNFTNKSSAIMASNIDTPIGFNGNSTWVNSILNVIVGPVVNVICQAFKFLVPDITIGTENRNYGQIYRDVNHELAHASHFSVVGSSFWAKYIDYIITYGVYGDGTGNNAELCAISEMWAYAVGEIRRCEGLYGDTISGEYDGLHKNDWFKPQVIWDLYRYNVLSLKEIHDCMQGDIRTYNSLISEMCSRYPDKAIRIQSIFMTYGLLVDTTLPNTGGDINYDSFLCNQICSDNYIYSGRNIYVNSFYVFSEASVEIECSKSVTIDYPFAVESGASLVIKKTN